jgi:hypothetical protein
VDTHNFFEHIIFLGKLIELMPTTAQIFKKLIEVEAWHLKSLKQSLLKLLLA